jgi:hypothetical protein
MKTLGLKIQTVKHALVLPLNVEFFFFEKH